MARISLNEAQKLIAKNRQDQLTLAEAERVLGKIVVPKKISAERVRAIANAAKAGQEAKERYKARLLMNAATIKTISRMQMRDHEYLATHRKAGGVARQDHAYSRFYTSIFSPTKVQPC